MKKYVKNVLIDTIFIFIISFLVHSFYEMLPNKVTLIFFPVNESIWEHMKMIFTSYVLYIFIKYLFFNKKTIFFDTIAALINIIVFLIIYLPIYYIFGEHLVVTLILYFISIFISLFIRKYLVNTFKISDKFDNLGFVIIIAVYMIFTFLTYYPPNTDIFIDHVNDKLGIYKIKN